MQSCHVMTCTCASVHAVLNPLFQFGIFKLAGHKACSHIWHERHPLLKGRSTMRCHPKDRPKTSMKHKILVEPGPSIERASCTWNRHAMSNHGIWTMHAYLRLQGHHLSSLIHAWVMQQVGSFLCNLAPVFVNTDHEFFLKVASVFWDAQLCGFSLQLCAISSPLLRLQLSVKLQVKLLR